MTHNTSPKDPGRDATRFLGKSKELSSTPEALTIAEKRTTPHLIAVNGAQRGSVLILGSEPVTVGRGAESEITVEDEKASRIHARIQADDGGYSLLDLDSKNGTWLRGPLRSESRPLRDGDRFRVGETEFLFFDPLELLLEEVVERRIERSRKARRRAPRVTSSIAYSSGRVDGQGLLYDVSQSGARIIDPSAPVTRGASVRIVLSMGPAKDALVLRGKALRVSNSGFAVEFSETNDRLRKILSD